MNFTLQKKLKVSKLPHFTLLMTVISSCVENGEQRISQRTERVSRHFMQRIISLAYRIAVRKQQRNIRMIYICYALLEFARYITDRKRYN